MAWSKSTRISIMLGIDVVFFLVELITGFIVGSLALTADAFHMLNDIISLLVGLWAVHLAQKETTDKYSYGWLRAEILGAFFNAVFLIALCVSIILEALTRIIDPPEITNAQLILIVGSFGLLSNLVGFVVLGGHGHSHGEGEHSHNEDGEAGHAHAHDHSEISAAEQGRAGSHVGNENGRPADVFPEAAVARISAGSPTKSSQRHIAFQEGERHSEENLERSTSKWSGDSSSRRRRRTSSLRRNHLNSIENLSIHPASFRQDIIASARTPVDEVTDESGSEDAAETAIDESTEQSPLIKADGHGHKHSSYGANGQSPSKHSRSDSNVHGSHNHNKPKKPSSKGHSHSHADMGMNAMILHVIGDALGNVGVIVTALIIWLTDWPGKFYADPAVSLFITIIILRSAIPLTLASSKILLQATPEGIDVQDLREDIESLPGVISCHHIHIWQLSDTKIVASMHIYVSFTISEAGGQEYMDLSRRVRRCLHAYGIHSATIQPEFCLDKSHSHAAAGESSEAGSGSTAVIDGTGFNPRGDHEEHPCLLECIENCDVKGCCGSKGSKAESVRSDAGHGHASGNGHDHGHEH